MLSLKFFDFATKFIGEPHHGEPFLITIEYQRKTMIGITSRFIEKSTNEFSSFWMQNGEHEFRALEVSTMRCIRLGVKASFNRIEKAKEGFFDTALTSIVGLSRSL